MFFTAMAINSHALRQSHIGRRFSTNMQGLWVKSPGFKGLRGGPKKRNNILRIFIWSAVSTPLKNISQLGSLFPIYGKSKKSCSKPATSYHVLPHHLFILCHGWIDVRVKPCNPDSTTNPSCHSCQLVQPMVAVTAVYKGPAATVSLGDSYTLWWTNKKLLKMAIEIVDFPIKNGDFPLQTVSSVEGTKSLLLPSMSLLGSPCVSFLVNFPILPACETPPCKEVYGPVAKYGSRSEIHRGRSASPVSRGSNIASFSSTTCSITGRWQKYPFPWGKSSIEILVQN